MNPEEMQTRIELLREEWRTVCLIASEPGQTPVHPSGVVERDEIHPLEDGIEDASEDRFVRPEMDFEF